MRNYARVLVDTHHPHHKIVNDALALLTVISIASVVMETVDALSAYTPLFIGIEWVAVLFFSLEYVGRMSCTKPAWRYGLSFFGIVDLVSILPTFFGLGNWTFLKSARAFRIIRLLRMVRLAKIARTGFQRDEDMGVLSINILLYFATLTTALLFTGTAMYLVEPETSAFASIPSGMWWSLKVFLGGIPVQQPLTLVGETFFILTNFIGLLLLGLLIGVVGNLFRNLLLGKDSTGNRRRKHTHRTHRTLTVHTSKK